MATTTDHDGIVVSAIGRVTVKPDIADVRLGVTISRDTVADARSEAARTMASIMTAILATGVAEDDVRTSQLSVQPRYDYRDGQAPRLAGYDVSNVAEVTVRDLATIGEVIDGGLRAGASSLDGLTFRVDDPTEPERAARVAAVAAARARAEVLASAAGVTITGVAMIVEGGAAPSHPAFKSERMMIVDDGRTPVSAGTTEIAVGVTITYRIG